MTRQLLPIALKRARARGVSLLTAVFLVVVLAVLSAAIIAVFTSQQSSSALDALGARADQAARSGLEWGVYRQLRVQNGVSVACFTPSEVTFALPAAANSTLSGFSVTVSCVAGANLAGNTTNRWTIKSVACNKPGASGCLTASNDPDAVRRQVQAELN
jgi:MSHA biogenesis protein MshP